MAFNKKLVLIIFTISVVFFLLVGFNISPYVRGPGEWPPEWRWPYLFVNTIGRIWAPLGVISLVLLFFILWEKQRLKLDSLARRSPSGEVGWIKLILLVILSYLFQLSILYFSRSGISVLIHRIINPDLNGYFTEAIKIKNLGEFFADYQKNVLNFSMHATGHPPGVLIFFWLIEKTIGQINLLKSFVQNLAPNRVDVGIIWNSLILSQRVTAAFSAFFIPLLGSLNIIPLFFLAKKLFNWKTAERTVFLATFIPALTLFTPLFDIFFPSFFLWSFYLFIKGLKEKNNALIFFSGLIFSLGLFFSLSLLPLIFIYLYYLIKNKKSIVYFFSGLTIFYLILFLFRYNVFSTSYTLMTGLPKNRSYLSWVLYNLYDFFVFAGIPTAIIYFWMLIKRIKEPLFISFTIMLLLLNFSGAVRGEVGRIWLPLMFPLTLIVSNFLTNKLRLSTKDFLVILFIQATQILIIQEFWVTLW